MGEETKIQWCDHTFNPWVGCVKVSPGCEHCYAEAMAKRFGGDVWGPAKTHERKLFGEAHWREPVQWDAKAKAEGVRRRVFCASMADVFEDHPQVEDARRRLLDLIIVTPWLQWLLLTKRPENVNWMIEHATGFSEASMWFHALGDNVWVGASVESQEWADKRIPDLLRVPAKVRFLSAEPLLGPIDLYAPRYEMPDGRMAGALSRINGERGIHWVIVGGESGPKARPMQTSWAYKILSDCMTSYVPVFVKQLGSDWARKHGADDRKGGDMSEWPANLRIRDFP